MSSRLCFTIRYLQPFFHGRGDAGRPEWPPSPFRLFQALVAAAAARWNERVALDRSVAAFRWFEELQDPEIIAPDGRASRAGYRTYVPDNVGDVVARSWSREGIKEIADVRVEKDVHPTYINGDAVHYVYRIAGNGQAHVGLLTEAAQSLTHLGWGIDMVVGDATIITDEQACQLKGDRWLPVARNSGTALRTPCKGCLDELMSKHEAFLNRLSRDCAGNEFFSPVPPLSRFRSVNYGRAMDPEPRCWTAFTLLKPDASARRAFNTARRTRDVAGMVRHAVAEAAKQQGWSSDEINVFVHGKTPDGSRPASGHNSPDRFLYLPLPTINRALNRVESIRRVLIAAPSHCGQRVAWLRRALAGAELHGDQNEPVALLTVLPSTDWVLRQYYKQSMTWSTVTPVILPIHEGYKPESAGKWIRMAFEQAGYASELIARSKIEWRRVGFRPGVDLASRYCPPKNLENKPRYQVRVSFPHCIPGPVVVGSGRFRGFGVFASESTDDE
ncbi:MAG: type I-U CRISPR-associated protein Cas5/Cas6 [Planctomycetaceae bacterium]|nr:type I-U CRISPR-associated protein Cas5/Cas6 [Planctomycetaceae bacterium]